MENIIKEFAFEELLIYMEATGTIPSPSVVIFFPLTSATPRCTFKRNKKTIIYTLIGPGICA